jgi:cell shape-determining protein MreC
MFKFSFKNYYDERIFNDFEDKNSIYLGFLKIFLFIHVFCFFFDLFCSFFYFFEFLLNIILKFIFFFLSEILEIFSLLFKFLAFEKRKYYDYEKLEKEIKEF